MNTKQPSPKRRPDRDPEGHILCGTDLSLLATEAASVAAAITGRLRIPFRLLHVLDEPVGTGTPREGSCNQTSEIKTMIKLTRQRFVLVFGLAVSLSSTFTPAAFAANVGAGTVAEVSGTTAAADPTLAGDVIYDAVLPFSITLATGGTITGTFQDRVVRSDVLGTLDFYARIISDSSSAGDVSVFARGHFNNYPGTGSSASMDYRTDDLGSVAPLYAGRSSDSSGVDFRFNFADGLAAGQDSNFMFYRTTATAYDLKGTGYVAHYSGNGSNNPYNYSNFLTLAQPVPETETYALLMAGLGLLGAVVRRGNNR